MFFQYIINSVRLQKEFTAHQLHLDSEELEKLLILMASQQIVSFMNIYFIKIWFSTCLALKELGIDREQLI